MPLLVTSRMQLSNPKNWIRRLSTVLQHVMLWYGVELFYIFESHQPQVTPCTSRTKRDQIQEAYCQITKLDVAMNGMLQRAKQLAYLSLLCKMFTMPHIPMLSVLSYACSGLWARQSQHSQRQSQHLSRSRKGLVRNRHPDGQVRLRRLRRSPRLSPRKLEPFVETQSWRV